MRAGLAGLVREGGARALREEQLGWARLAGLPGLLAEFLLAPTDRGLLRLVSGWHYVCRARTPSPATRPPFWAALAAACPTPLATPGLRVEKRPVDSPLLLRTLSDLYVAKACAATPRQVRAHNPEGDLCALCQLVATPTFKIEYPTFATLIRDSAKLVYLDKLLQRIRAEGRKALIFCQMTKMLNLLEEYLQHRKYTYLRMDGASQIAERRDRVHKFQTNRDIFVFLLSTRAGGLGVTLTAADVVVFYDNDWNPTMDAQAADRAHRIGRREDVNVYRLVTKSTIEERIVKRAQQKNSVQQTVYSGEVFKGNVFSSYDVMSLLFDESELRDQESKELLRGGERARARRGGEPEGKAEEVGRAEQEATAPAKLEVC